MSVFEEIAVLRAERAELDAKSKAISDQIIALINDTERQLAERTCDYALDFGAKREYK